MATLDRSEGTVTSCAYDLDSLRAAAAHSDGEHMGVGIRVSRENSPSTDPIGSDQSVWITLVLENNVWKVDNADPAHLLF